MLVPLAASCVLVTAGVAMVFAAGPSGPGWLRPTGCVFLGIGALLGCRSLIRYFVSAVEGTVQQHDDEPTASRRHPGRK
ncbi:MAG: hypothetical protein ACYS8L_08370 [Planctomycetota bacterium]|jgi:hypothetical protein